MQRRSMPHPPGAWQQLTQALRIDKAISGSPV